MAGSGRRTLGPYGPREDDGPPAGHPQARYPQAGYPQAGYPEARYPEAGYPEARYPEARYPEARYPGRPGPARPGYARPRGARPERSRFDRTGGADGNERLTAATGAVLLVLFAAEGFTILSIHQLITVHFFLGMLLIGPVALKAATVCYRFTRYYTGAPEYRRKGPPAPLLRLLGPVVLGTSIGVLGTGVMLAVDRSAAGSWLFLHKACFVLWFGAMTVHVLAYVWRLPGLIGADLVGSPGVTRARQVLAGRGARWLLLAASILAGLVIALTTVHLAAPWQGLQHFG